MATAAAPRRIRPRTFHRSDAFLLAACAASSLALAWLIYFRLSPFVDAMSGIPSIVAGLFIYVVFIVGLGVHFSGVMAALALSILMLPTVTRTTEVVLRLVPDGLREASLALGAPEWRTVLNVVLPT